MSPKGAIDQNGAHQSSYVDWLMSPSCEIPPYKDTVEHSKLGKQYIDSVPHANRLALRWGWKIPKTMYVKGIVIYDK